MRAWVNLIRTASLCGFFLMPLDLRQHGGKHADVWWPSFSAMPASKITLPSPS